MNKLKLIKRKNKTRGVRIRNAQSIKKKNMLHVYLWCNYMSEHNMVFVDEFIGWVHEAWWYKNGSRYMKDEGFRKETRDLISRKNETI